MRLRVRKLARAEVHAAFEWYLIRSPRAATAFLETVDAAIKSLERAPKRQAIIRGQIRRVFRHPAIWLRRI